MMVPYLRSWNTICDLNSAPSDGLLVEHKALTSSVVLNLSTSMDKLNHLHPGSQSLSSSHYATPSRSASVINSCPFIPFACLVQSMTILSMQFLTNWILPFSVLSRTCSIQCAKDGIVKSSISEVTYPLVLAQNKGNLNTFCYVWTFADFTNDLPWINTLFLLINGITFPMGFSFLYHSLPENWILANSFLWSWKHNTYFMVTFGTY